MNPIKIESIETRMATKDDGNIAAYDHTILSAVNTCPTWGLIRYGHHKIMPDVGRAMALEAGGASHDCFAAIRVYQLWKYSRESDIIPALADYHGRRLFGSERFNKMKSVLDDNSTERTNVINFALEALYSSGFYDSDSDKKRTVSNIAEAMIVYIDRFDMKRYPIWIRDHTNPMSDVGIEIPYDIIVNLCFSGKTSPSTELKRRFTGILDALVMDGNDLMVDENKTGARLDDAWLAQWQLSHQITGYCIAANTFTGLECHRARVVGMRIPIGKVLFEGIRVEPVNRASFQYEDWAKWFIHSVEMFETFKDDIKQAPRYTHSCNRYFRPCSLTSYCGSDEEERTRILEEMIHDKWSPLGESS